MTILLVPPVLALAVSLALSAAVYWLWSDRIKLNAPTDQRREAEEHG